MVEPKIRYVRTKDGASLATATLGAGPPLLMLATGLGGIEASFSIPVSRMGLESLIDRFTFITYDPRGQGLSDRNITDFSLEARVSDLCDVVLGLGLPPLNLLARGITGATAIAFTAQNPDRVERLVMWAATARGQDFSAGPRLRAIGSLVEIDWPLYCQVLALLDFGWTEAARISSEAMAKSISPQAYAENWTASHRHDASEYTAGVRCPTLVVNPRASDVRRVSFDAIRSLAATIPNAEFRTDDSLSLFTFIGEESVNDARIIAEFFSGEAEASRRQEGSGTAVILFADIADSTGLTERLGDSGFRAKARELDGALRAIISAQAGAAIDGKLLGDGVLATFTSAAQAIEGALACASAGNEVGLPLHIGLHAGDVIREENNVFGGTVNIAARISGLSAPGQILVSDVVRGMARSSSSVDFKDCGEQSMKGVGEAVRVYEVRAAEGR